jgi:hypothetical protein
MAQKEWSNDRILIKKVHNKLIFLKSIDLKYPLFKSIIETSDNIDEALELDYYTFRWYMIRLDELNQFSLSTKFICNDHV